MNTRASLTIGLPAFILLLGGCIIVDGTTGVGGAGGAGNTGNDRITSSSSSSSSGTGGVGGEGGAGGIGGQGGGSSCAGPNDGMLDLNACAALNTQSTGNVCGPNGDQAPAANGACTRLHTIIQGGAFDVVARCLQNIPGDVASACDDMKVAACVKEMYASACPSQDASNLCLQFAQQNCVQAFDTMKCVLDLTPFSAAGLNEMITCMNMHLDVDCNNAYGICYPQVFSY